MVNNIRSLLEKIRRGDLLEEMTKVKVFGLPGLTWFTHSEFKKVEQELKGVLAQVEEREGQDHAATALINYFLGDAYMRDGRIESAETHFVKAMEIWAETDEENFRGIIRKLLDLADGYVEAGNLSKAERLGRILVDSGKKYLSQGDSLIVSALTDLGSLFHMQGRTSEGEDLFREALLRSEQNPDTLSRYGPRILMNLAAVCTSRREFPGAEEHLNRALEIAEAAEVRNESHVLEILCNKAKVCAALNKMEEFYDATTQAQEAYEAAWKSDPETVVPLMLDVFRLLNHFGRDDAAKEIYERLKEDTAALLKTGNEQSCLGIIDAWLRDFNLKGGDAIIGEIWRENKRKFEEHFRRVRR